jgi:uncharacterized membrane protein (DUF4010 family)
MERAWLSGLDGEQPCIRGQVDLRPVVSALDEKTGEAGIVLESAQDGSTRRTVVTRSIARSNDAIVSMPLASALATRYASAKSIRLTRGVH